MWDPEKPLSSFGVRKAKDLHVRAQPDFADGEIVRNYRVRELIGRGGFGEVYRAENVSIDQSVAIKAYRVADESALKAFQRGASLLAQIRHPNVIAIYDFFTLGRFALMVMELLDPASTLRRHVGEFGNPRGTDEFLRLFLPLVGALRVCHQTKVRETDEWTGTGVCHGDIKPDNVFLVSGTVKLADFMIPNLEEFLAARKWGECFPYYDTRAYGTPMYMSPEQLGGNISVQTDIYNLGVTGFELLTGFYPYESEDDYRAAKYQLPENFNPYCPPWLSRLLIRCIAHDCSIRYHHVAEIERDILANWRAHSGSKAVPLPITMDSEIGGGENAPIRIPRPVSHQYDVALSFAGDDRAIARQLAGFLTASGISVFYDEYEQAHLWGKDLYQHLARVYNELSRYCVILVSESYAAKLWTRHELRQAQARAFRNNREYVLPLRLDDTSIPGIPETIGYIDLRIASVEYVAELVVQKVKATTDLMATDDSATSSGQQTSC